jgi:hypothetical protein
MLPTYHDTVLTLLPFHYFRWWKLVKLPRVRERQLFFTAWCFLVLHTTTGSYSKNNVSLDVRGEEVVKDKNRKSTCLASTGLQAMAGWARASRVVGSTCSARRRHSTHTWLAPSALTWKVYYDKLAIYRVPLRARPSAKNLVNGLNSFIAWLSTQLGLRVQRGNH